MRPLGHSQVYMGRVWLRLQEQDWAEAAAEFTTALAVPLETGDASAAPGCLDQIERFCVQADGLAPAGSPIRLAFDELMACLHLWRGRVDEALAVGKAAEVLREQVGGYPVLGSDLSALLAAAGGGAPATGRSPEF